MNDQLIRSGRLALLLAVLAVLAVSACDTDGDGGPPRTVYLDAGDGGPPTDAASPTPPARDAASPDATVDDEICFPDSLASPLRCVDICQPFTSCDLPFGSCEQGCNAAPAPFERCAASTDQCDRLRRCLECASACPAAPTCGGGLSVHRCCARCVGDPSCFDADEPTCRVVSRCQ